MEPSIPIIIPRKGRTRQYDLVHKADILKQLKAGIWAYFILLIIEGALRKWFFPRLATPLLVVRDPLAMWLLFVAWKNNEMPSNWYIKSIVFIGIFAI